MTEKWQKLATSLVLEFSEIVFIRHGVRVDRRHVEYSLKISDTRAPVE
jgi:hypothetical protein